MQKMMKVAVMLSFGFISTGYAADLPANKTANTQVTTTTTTTTDSAKNATTPTNDQVLMGTTSAPSTTTSNTQGSGHDHAHDEDMD